MECVHRAVTDRWIPDKGGVRLLTIRVAYVGGKSAHKMVRFEVPADIFLEAGTGVEEEYGIGLEPHGEPIEDPYVCGALKRDASARAADIVRRWECKACFYRKIDKIYPRV